MITTLAPLGATHTIVLSLAYGDVPTIPPAQDSAETQAAVVPQQTVTVTAYLKPKDGKKGEPKTLQFEGSVADVEKALAEQLPLAVQKVTAHMSSLEQLDAQLAAEKEKATKEAESKAASPGKDVTPPKGVKSRTVYPATSKKAEAKKADTPKPTGAAAAALAKVKEAAEKGKAAAEAQSSVTSPAVSMAAVPASPAPVATEPPPAETEHAPSLEDLAASLPSEEVSL